MMTNPYAGAAPGKIRILPETTANQIAAGEVVERPASILKELVENSLDALAENITIAIRNGGKSSVDVIDDGAGMERDDAILSLERHATSKIRDHQDMNSLTSLGFRGEALPSIASVARMTLTTCVRGAAAGVQAVIEGGKLLDVRDCAPSPGTRVEANALFFNVPARRKFLKSESSEGQRCHEAVLRQALGAPGCGFTFLRDGKLVFKTDGAEKGAGGLGKRINDLFGQRVFDTLTPVDHSQGSMRISGFVSRPGGGRTARDMQYIYVNGRIMNDRLIFHAVNEAYRSLLPRGVYPSLFLYLDIPRDKVDVNVSPTKAEARFSDAGMVIGLVRDGLGFALSRSEGAGPGALISSAAGFSPAPFPRPIELKETMAPFHPYIPPRASGTAGGLAAAQAPEPAAGLDEPGQAQHLDLGLEIPESYRVIGQVFNTFILLEADERLFLVDQHTAHERINYEKLYAAHNEGKVESQELLFPVPLELSPSRTQLAGALAGGLLRDLGFALEEFGPEEFHIRAVPRLLSGADIKGMVVAILDKAERFGPERDFSALAESVINIMACRGAVKAGDRLDPREISSLMERLGGCRLPYTCPHGRPVALSISREDLYRGFLRK